VSHCVLVLFIFYCIVSDTEFSPLVVTTTYEGKGFINGYKCLPVGVTIHLYYL